MAGIRKPVGVNGPVFLTDRGAEFQQLEYPTIKEEIEMLVAKSFSAGPIPGGLQISSLEQQDQNDFDFKAKSNFGFLNLELMEIAPLENLRGSYAKAPSEYKPYDFAKYIHAKAMRKSERYGGSKVPRIVLLLYVTDWAFVLSESVICLLQYWLQNTPNNFFQVYVHHPVQLGFGVTRLLLPTPEAHWATFNPETLRENIVTNLSPIKWEYHEG
nr:hypothetical protein [uncultured Undibacterium sp.]